MKTNQYNIYNTLLCLLLFALPISEAIKQIALYLFILCGFYIIITTKAKIKLDILNLSLIAYALFFVLSAIINEQYKSITDPLRSVIFFLVIRTVSTEQINIKNALKALFLGYLIAYIWGAYNIFFNGKDLFELKSIGYVNTSAIFSLFILIISLCALRAKILDFRLCGFMILLAFSAIILSASRTVIYLLPILFIFSLFIVFDFKLQKRDLIITLCVLFALGLFAFLLSLLPHDRIAYKISLGGTFLGIRINIFVSAIYAWLENPFFGIGRDNFILLDNSIYFPDSPEPHAPHAHNVVLNLLATTGIFTTISYIVFQLSALISFAKNYKLDYSIKIALLITLFSNVCSLVELTFHSENLLLTLLFFGLAASQINKAKA